MVLTTQIHVITLAFVQSYLGSFNGSRKVGFGLVRNQISNQTLFQIRVEIDIAKALAGGKSMSIEKVKLVWVHFRYELLLDFCLLCGVIKHIKKFCSKTSQWRKKQTKLSRSIGLG